MKGRRDKRKRKHNHNSAGIDVVVRRQSLLFGGVSTPHLAHSYTGAMSMLHQCTHHHIERTLAYTTLAPADILPTNPKNPFQTRGTVLLYVYPRAHTQPPSYGWFCQLFLVCSCFTHCTLHQCHTYTWLCNTLPLHKDPHTHTAPRKHFRRPTLPKTLTHTHNATFRVIHFHAIFPKPTFGISFIQEGNSKSNG